MKLAVLTLSILSLAATTFAVDAKIYPGSMAVRWTSSDPVPHLNASALFNPSSTKTLRVDLPVIHDIIAKSIKSGWVKVVDRHYSHNIRCNLMSVYRSGGGFYGWTGPNRYSSGSGTGPQTLNFPGLGSNSVAHYYVSCSIPRTYSGNRSGIVSYRVDEKT